MRLSVLTLSGALLAAGPLLADPMTSTATAAAADTDPYLWLEDVEGERALDWVREQNDAATAVLEADPRFADLQRDLLAILDSDERIPFVSKQGDYLYNFWRDAKNPQGIWRRTTMAQYRTDTPDWELLLDIDALGKAEDVNWVWGGASCLRPDYQRCLVSLSRGGADATVTREFDIGERAFVEDGFRRDEAKGGMVWKDKDTVYVFTDFGPGSMTPSGYPRIAKQWRRGTPMSEATVVYEGQASDMYIAAYRDDTPGFERDLVSRTLAFYNDELYLRGADGELTKVDAPNSANKSLHREWLLLELREPLAAGAATHAAGSLLAIELEAFMAGGRDFDVLFEPSASTSLVGVSPTRNHLIVNVLDDVKNRLYVLTHADGEWTRKPLQGAPAFGTVSVGAVDDEVSDDYFLTVTDYLTPTTLMLGSVGEDPVALKRLPAFFDTDGLRISQHFASSEDGTRVPYFMVAGRDIELDGSNPTLLYGYGGFEVSMTPAYSPAAGRAWLSQGGVFVVANIRGGGEYGPRWHQAALKANRLRAYEDFAAVARDLIERKVTSPRHLGIQGGSNGGLLVGNMTVLYPELFGAVVCQVPLLDMKRYHTLLAGASWMAEYGDPDKPEEWQFIQTFSPYQNVKDDGEYPPVLFTTSTRDDRVHPGHARKMMAKMKAQGHDVLYFENIEGGHGGSANNAQAARMQALGYTFLRQKLFPAD
jgi:prolyl oligopeptidase